jgi:hypothetical protein
MFDTKYTSRSASYRTDSGVLKPGIDATRRAESPPVPPRPLAAAESRRSAESAVAPRSADSPEHAARATTEARTIVLEIMSARMLVPDDESEFAESTTDGPGNSRRWP